MPNGRRGPRRKVSVRTSPYLSYTTAFIYNLKPLYNPIPPALPPPNTLHRPLDNPTATYFLFCFFHEPQTRSGVTQIRETNNHNKGRQRPGYPAPGKCIRCECQDARGEASKQQTPTPTTKRRGKQQKPSPHLPPASKGHPFLPPPPTPV